MAAIPFGKLLKKGASSAQPPVSPDVGALPPPEMGAGPPPGAMGALMGGAAPRRAAPRPKPKSKGRRGY
jgi:hypothetical protein